MSAPVYTIAELLEILRTSEDADIRVCVGEMIFVMGQHDQLMQMQSAQLHATAGLVK